MIESVLDKAEAVFGAWQRGLVFESKRYRKHSDKGQAVQEKVRPRQNELICAVRDGPAALGQYLRQHLGLDCDEDIGAPALTRPALTVNEYLDPPIELEAELGRAWMDKVSLRRASQPVFWLLCHIDWIERKRLGAAGDLGQFLLLKGTSEPDSETKTRNFLRRTGGIFLRGKISVFSDCTMARAWWRFHLSRQIAAASGGRVSRETAHRVLHANRPAWETFVLDSLRRIVAVSHPRARAAIVHQLARILESHGGIKKQQVRHMGIGLARLGLRNSLGHVDRSALTDAASGAMQSDDTRPTSGTRSTENHDDYDETNRV